MLLICEPGELSDPKVSASIGNQGDPFSFFLGPSRTLGYGACPVALQPPLRYDPSQAFEFHGSPFWGKWHLTYRLPKHLERASGVFDIHNQSVVPRRRRINFQSGMGLYATDMLPAFSNLEAIH